MSIAPEAGSYPTFKPYTIVHTTTGVSGTFSSFINSLPTLRASVVYTLNDILLQIQGFQPFSNFFTSGNAGTVAAVLDTLFAAGISCSNLNTVNDALHALPTIDALKSALLQMQPSAFTSLSVAQENATLHVRKTIYDRLEQPLHSCLSPDLERPLNIWIAALGARTSQRNAHSEPGFIIYEPGAFLGFDSRFADRVYFGGGLGYNYIHLHWRERRGNADIQSAIASVYGRWATPRFFLESALMGSYNSYTTHRHISFGTIHNTARGKHHGGEGSASAKAGINLNFGKSWALLPYLSADYIFIHENSFKERGAHSLDLKVKSKNSDLLSSEGGIDLSYCRISGNHCYTPFIKISAIRESRFQGKKEKASLCGANMTVKGLYPSRTLGSVSAGLDAFISNNVVTISYQGKFAHKYNDQVVDIEYRYQF